MATKLKSSQSNGLKSSSAGKPANNAMQTRPPIVAVLGHVDHGKTSLLDAIRSTNVQSSESGGITQHIGAYQATYQDRLITFIDTPGHAAFTAMRARGGQIADLAILVVAADDGVMPQTKESISHISDAGIPFVVALNKIDIPGNQPDRIKGQLAEAGVLVEGFGGNTPIIEVSATKKTNLDTLLENLLLLADLEELKANPEGILEAIVIESNLDKRRGPVATLIVKSGTLKIGDTLSTIPTANEDASTTAKVKAMFDWQAKPIKEAPPATPVQILGFAKVPSVGATVTSPDSIDQFKTKLTTATSETSSISTDDTALNIILKADVVGTLEAITGSLPENVHLVHSGTGSINESDILLADTSHSRVYGFRIKPTPSAKKLAEIEGVSIYTFETIYDLLDAIKAVAKKTKDDNIQEVVFGEAKILRIFNLPELRVIGAIVTSGVLTKKDIIHLQRPNLPVKDATITSLKIGTKEVGKVKEGQEFGAIITPDLDAKPGDMLISFTKPEE